MFLCLQHANLGVLTTLRIGHDNTGKNTIHLQSLLTFSVMVRNDFKPLRAAAISRFIMLMFCGLEFGH